ncbi:MAG: HAMP domain-containing sensor histidine kinase [Sulfuricellaceae bacterium]|nr:HAMP domain-containing sensor histidine kinase [Sulfuricellaceae bacterium]
MSDPEKMDFADVFASGAHEIKNEMFLLLNALDEISHESWAKAYPAALALDRIKAGSTHISRRLTHLLALYRMGSGSYGPDIGYNSLAEMLEEVAIEIRSSLGARLDDTAVVISIEPSDDLYAFFDYEIVRSILLNALHNALRAGARKISLGAAKEADFVCIRVEDNGPGFPPEMLKSNAEVQGMNISKGSTGLGLLFSRKAAGLHNSQGKRGFLRLQNGGLLGGAVFTLCLP